MSTLGRKYSYCATLETNEYAGWPPEMMPTSNEVPPMSVVIMFEQSINPLKYSEPVTPDTGPESSVNSGDSIALSTEIEPPAHCVICSGCVYPDALSC